MTVKEFISQLEKLPPDLDMGIFKYGTDLVDPKIEQGYYSQEEKYWFTKKDMEFYINTYAACPPGDSIQYALIYA
jgi:hypothetical protein